MTVANRKARCGANRRDRRREAGIALLATLLLSTALLSAVGVLAASIREAAREQRSRSDVLCARYAATGALAAGTAANGRPDLISTKVDQLLVTTIRHGPDHCSLRATAHCGGAQRSAQRPVECRG